MDSQGHSSTIDRGEGEPANTAVEDLGQGMAPPAQAQNRQKRTVCSSDDFGILLDYLEQPSNFEKLFGSGRKANIGGKHVRKEAQWDIATIELKSLGFPKTNEKNLQKKWYSYFTKFKEAKAITKESGGGLTEDEVDRGLTLAAKLNGICDHFYRVDALLGTRANVDPPAESGPMGFQNFNSAGIQGPPQSILVAPLEDNSPSSPTLGAQSGVVS